MLSDAERSAVATAIAGAEQRTTGEIVCIIAREASAYRSWALFLASAAGFATPGVLLALTTWSAGLIWAVQLLVALGVGLLLWPRRLRLALTPGFLKRERARDAAHRQFIARGLQATSGRTGVLIYIAASERYVEVIADDGVAALAGEAEWRSAVEQLVVALRAGAPGAGLIQVVERLGALLAQHYPAEPEAPLNQLPDHVILM